MIFVLLHLHILAVLAVQWVGSRRLLSASATLTLSAVIIALEVAIPPFLVLEFDIGPDRGCIVLALATIYMMKLVSYVHVNHNLRCAHDQRLLIQQRRLSYHRDYRHSASTPSSSSSSAAAASSSSSSASASASSGPAPAAVVAAPAQPAGYNSIVGGTLRYPENLTVRNMYHFMMLPTLVYQLSYPRTDRPIRWGFLARRIGELVFFTSLIIVLVDQYIQPTLANALPPMKTNDMVGVVERLLKLAVPNLYVWLLGFYCFFHLWLNILAEVFHFADRRFYADWWNATTVGNFWSSWNIITHHWIAAHIFQPCKRNGMSKFSAFLLSFFVSALFHEYIVAFPFKTVKMWAFSGMMAQVPLVYITQGMKNNQAGNVIFWLSITLGQPFAILMYYRDYVQLTSAS
eukprot:TRINITY_DN6059_c0_g1_i2.p1 TRINITY_DN6059_c0_g1~~TRINITY_DN6059_c0_g1_i2.p1  ORF type:complete len:459 (+),score=174.76 TRINITY_DN6059_c0_g1_i2:170-1378(+)